MIVSEKRRGNQLIIGLSGEIDHHYAMQIKSKLDMYLKDPQIRHLILDMGQVVFMDSSGIGVLLGRYKTMASRNGKMGICHVRPQIDKVLRMSGIYQLIEKYD